VRIRLLLGPLWALNSVFDFTLRCFGFRHWLWLCRSFRLRRDLWPCCYLGFGGHLGGISLSRRSVAPEDGLDSFDSFDFGRSIRPLGPFGDCHVS
jgi:hypothetical protein